MINSQWLELPMSRTIFYGPKDVRAIEIRLYLDKHEGSFTSIVFFLLQNIGFCNLMRAVSVCDIAIVSGENSNFFFYFVAIVSRIFTKPDLCEIVTFATCPGCEIRWSITMFVPAETLALFIAPSGHTERWLLRVFDAGKL